MSSTSSSAPASASAYDISPELLTQANSFIPTSDVSESWLDSDLALIQSADWRHRESNATGDECSVIKLPNDPVWWIKVVGLISGSLFNIDDLLDSSICERQSEWHELFIGGRSVLKSGENVEICYFQYKSGAFLVSPRDCCYLKIRRNLFHPDGSARGFLLSFRSIPFLLNYDTKFERTTFSGAHLIEFTDDKAKFRYSYMQHADPGGWIPVALANRPQCSIILKEIDGVRRVAQKDRKIEPNANRKALEEKWIGNNEMKQEQ